MLFICLLLDGLSYHFLMNLNARIAGFCWFEEGKRGINWSESSTKIYTIEFAHAVGYFTAAIDRVCE